MKKRLIIGLGLAMILMAVVGQVALADTPGPAGSTNCIGYCISQGLPASVGLTNSYFARLHNPSIGGGCPMTAGNGTGYISDANPPQPHP